MPRLDLNLSPLNQQRQALAALQSQQFELDTALAAQQAALDAALRAGESPNVTGMLREQVNESRAARQQLLGQLREQARGIDQLSNGLLGELDPARMAEALDGGLPIALLPMRLETRYFPPDQAQSLRIRVYPDDINTIEHTAALTDKELQAGMDYWLARFDSDADEAARIARDLALGVGRSRCAWVLQSPDAGQRGSGRPGGCVAAVSRPAGHRRQGQANPRRAAARPLVRHRLRGRTARSVPGVGQSHSR